MQGKGLNSTDEAYFLDDPDRLREKYIQHMGCLTIRLDVNTIDVESPEFMEIQTKLREKEIEVESISEENAI